MEIIEQYGKSYTLPYAKKRIACRGLIVKDNKVLLSHEQNKGVFASPGGGLEGNETLEQCCVRELMEETGYAVKVKEQLFIVHEYCLDTLHISNYFLCEIIGTGERNLTEMEKNNDMMPKWVDINEAIEHFSKYDDYEPGRQSLYLREYTILNKYLKII